MLISPPKTDRMFAIIPGLRKTIAQHTKDLNGSGRVAHSAKLLGNIALVLIGILLVPILTFLAHHLAYEP